MSRVASTWSVPVGAGMGPLAKLLAAMGHKVSGSDLHPGPELSGLGRHGIETWQGSRPDRMPGCDLVVASSAVPADDPELVAAATADVTVWERPRLLEAITVRTPTIGATGTHGKTTSTALAITATRALGLDPSFVVGGELVGSDYECPPGYGRPAGARSGRGVRNLHPSNVPRSDGYERRFRPP